MRLLPSLAVLVFWVAWLYPFAFRAPHNQKRASITLAGPTRAGLLLECIGILIAAVCRMPASEDLGVIRISAGVLLGVVAPLVSWSAVKNLGRQFRVNAGLYHDHELVRTGAYALVRHPIYASLFAMLGCTIFLLTDWRCAIIAVALYIAGTEIRVRTEDGLLRSRFGEEFEEYRRHVKAYIPFIR